MAKNFRDELDRANQELTLVKIRDKGSRLYLRGTLPPKPGESNPQRRELAIGCVANLAGLKIAVARAKEIESQLQLGRFDWEPWLRESEKSPESCRDWIKRFEQDYFERKEDTPAIRDSYQNRYAGAFAQLPQGERLTVELLRSVAATKTTPNSAARCRFCTAYASLAKFAGFDTKPITVIRGNYKGRDPGSLIIPSDSEIIEIWQGIPNKQWQYVYGLIAAYGLRPHEVFLLDGPIAEDGLLKVSEHTKTGFRRVYPYPVEWLELFKLREGKLPDISAPTNRKLGRRVSKAFKSYGLPWPPYSLRHAYAVRLAAGRVPTAIAAKLLGHSVEMYSRTYLRHIGEDDLKRALGQG